MSQKIVQDTSHEQSFVASDWGKYAVCYDSILALRPYVEMLETVADKVRHDRRGITLDASCGTGNFEKIIEGANPKYSPNIIGVDSSSEMLKRAQEKCKNNIHFSFFKRDLNCRLSFENSFFSKVVSINTLYAVRDPESTLSEFRRILVPGGKLFLVTPKKGYENGLILKEHCKSHEPDEFWKDGHTSPMREEFLIRTALQDETIVQSMLTVGAYNRVIAATGTFHFYTPEDLIFLLKEVGFSVEDMSEVYANQALFVTATIP